MLHLVAPDRVDRLPGGDGIERVAVGPCDDGSIVGRFGAALDLDAAPVMMAA